MDVAENKGGYRVLKANWHEKFNFVSNKIASCFSSIKVWGYKLMGIMGVCFARLKSVILGKLQAGAQAGKQLCKESPVIRKFIRDMRSRWVPTRDRLDAMIGDTKPVLFKGDLDLLTSLIVISTLNGKTDLINGLLSSKCSVESINEKDRTKIYRAITAMEQAVRVLDIACKAREQKPRKEAIYYEIVLLGELLSISLRLYEETKATDIESMITLSLEQGEVNVPNFGTIINAMEDLTRIANSIVEDLDSMPQEIDPAVYGKGNDMMQLVGMFVTKRFSLRIGNAEDRINADFERAFFERHPEWNKLKKEHGANFLFYLLLANTNCLDLDDTKDMDKCRSYVRRLDEAKRLFYKDKDEAKAFEIAAAVVNEVLDIKPRSYEPIENENNDRASSAK